MRSLFVRLGVILAAAAVLAGCIVEDDPPRRVSGPAPQPTPVAPPSGAAGGSTTTTPPPPASGSTTPMLAVVDDDQTMTADPGQGVGVFIEYKTGGTWHLWWTCDTMKTGQTCDFVVSATLSQGTITNVDQQQLQGGFVAAPNASSVEAHVSTSNNVNGITFQTPAGAQIQVTASVGGVTDGSFLFFVQDGKVNGGFTGKLTDPLDVQGKTP